MKPVLFAIFLFVLVPVMPAQVPTPPVEPPGVVPSEPPPLSLARQYADLIPGLLEAMGDAELEVRQYAALALAGLREDAISPLSRALEDPNNHRRATAAYALGRMGIAAHRTIPLLLRRLKDEDPAVRRAAAEAISRMTSQGEIVFGELWSREAAPAIGRGGSAAPALPRVLAPPPASVVPSPGKVPLPPERPK